MPRHIVDGDEVVALGWQDLRVSLSRAATGANNPTLTALRGNVYAYAFSKTTDQFLYFDVQMPHGFVGGVAHPGGAGEVRPHIHWSNGANTASTGSVVWTLEYTYANAVNPPGNTFAATVTTAVTQSSAGTAYSHYIAEFPAIDCTAMRDSAVLMCRLSRNADDPADDFDDVAYALSWDLHYQIRQFGSLTEYGTALPS